jgi:hypothetical protein
VLGALGINLKLQLDNIAERLYSPAKDLLAVGLGANSLAIVAGKQELEDGVFVVEIPDGI